VPDLREQSALAPLVVGPLEGRHLKNLEWIARPPVDELPQLIDLAAPLDQLPLRQLHRHELSSETSNHRTQGARATPGIALAWRRRVHQQQIDVAMGIPVAARRGPEDTSV
jgi:hypothetical protein